MMLRLAFASLWNRRWTLLLTVISLVVSVALVLGIEHIRQSSKTGFNQTLVGTDLVVGARGSSINLLLYSVFRIGNATANVSWDSYQQLLRHSQVDWIVPIALGDSHRGYPVVGTADSYIRHYRYGADQPLHLAQGEWFQQANQVVLGAQVAKTLGYGLGDKLVLAHGSGKVSLHNHDDRPFVVTGVLAPTGTPVDKSLHISLAAIAGLHRDWQGGVPPSRRVAMTEAHTDHHDHDHDHDHDHKPQLVADAHPDSVTALLVGLKSRAASFTVQRQINQYPAEPLQAIIPGLALAEFWQMLGVVESSLQLIAGLVLVASLLGMTTSLLAAMGERRRELAILRALGAGPLYLFALLELEVMLLALLGLLGGVLLLALGLQLVHPWILDSYGVSLETLPNLAQLGNYALWVLGLALLLGLIPAWSAARQTLSQGLVVSR